MRGQRNLIAVGDRFGRLVVLRVWTEKCGTHKTKETRCECLCDCGNVIVTQGRYLRAKHKQSCNCLWKKTTGKNHHAWRGHGDISSTVWSGIRGEAKNRARTIPFDITIEQGWELYVKQEGRCALTGEPISFPKTSVKKSGSRTASLDRIDSSGDYTVDNIQWLHKDINLMKMDLVEEKFITWCHKVSKYNYQSHDGIVHSSTAALAVLGCRSSDDSRLPIHRHGLVL